MNMQYFKNNPDYQCPAYQTKNGIYTEGCGLQNVMMSWGHDEYMYLYFKDNPNYKCSTYNTRNGIYTEGCGLDNVAMSWGHDDYMYMVAKENGTTFPSRGLFIIGYHSFYRKPFPRSLHKKGAYTHLMNEEDFETLK
ncbi:hypothetical protein ACSQ67_004010 [Phaseolus vulgaris]